MALSSARGRISFLSTDTVGTTKTVSGLSFQPKLILFMWNGRTDTTDAVGRASIRRGFGAATSTTDRRAVTNTSLDAAANADGGAYHTNAAAVVLVNQTGAAVDALFDINAINSDGFQMIVDDQSPVNLDVDWIAIGGADLTNVTTFQFQAPGTTGAQSQDITSLSFQPTGVLFFGIDSATAPPAGVSTNIQMFLGAASGSGDDHIWHGGTDEGSNTMDTQAYCRAGECIAFMPGTGGKVLDGRAEFTQFLSNGFRLNWLEHATINRYVFGVAVAGIQFAVSNGLTLTNTTTDITVTPGFQPRAGLVVSACRAASTADTPTAHCRLSLGMIVSATDEGCRSMLDEDGVGTSEVSTGVEFDSCYQNISTASANDGLMHTTSVDSTGYTFRMTDADPAQSFFFVVAFGDSPATTGTASLSVTQPSIAASGGQKFSGTGAPAVTKPTIAASGTQKFAGTAALNVTQPTIAASGALQFSGTAALSVAQPAIAGSGSVVGNVTGTAALTVPQPLIAGTGAQKFSGTAVVVVTAPAIASSASERFVASVALTVAQPAIVGAGSNYSGFTATAALPVLAPVVAAAGVVANPVNLPSVGVVILTDRGFWPWHSR